MSWKDEMQEVLAPSTFLIPGVKRREVRWDEAKNEILDGSILLWEPHDFIGREIARNTNGPFCHASVCGFAWGSLFEGGYHIQGDGSINLLRKQVRLYSGKIHVFKIHGLTDAERHAFAVHAMNGLAGKYADEDILLNAMSETWLGQLLLCIPPLYRWWVDRAKRMSRKKSTADCSQNVVRAAREALRMSLCSGKPEALVSPNDIGRSARLDYCCSPVWPKGWKT